MFNSVGQNLLEQENLVVQSLQWAMNRSASLMLLFAFSQRLHLFAFDEVHYMFAG
jgi:hypothetical protein